MSTAGNWRGPDIVKDGLILYLDAGSPNSFYSPTAGTTWKDISGNGNNGTLTNGPTFNSGNGGSIVFDGIDDSVETNITSPFGTTLYTYEAWIKYTATQTGNIISKRTPAGSFQQLSLFIANTANGSTAGKRIAVYHSGTNTRTLITNLEYGDGNWHHVVLTVGILFNTIYVDGVAVNTSNSTSIPNLNLEPPIVIGATNNSSTPPYTSRTVFFSGNIGLAKIYNRALSATEVLQNYNATKGRFGL